MSELGGLTREGAHFANPARELEFLAGDPPEPGHARAIAPGLWWLRVPLPMELNHINIWLHEDAHGWTIVDTGMADDVCREAWGSFDRTILGGRPLRRVFITHDHPDHMGLASWLVERYGAEVWMSAWGHESSQRFLATSAADVQERAADFMQSHGMEVASFRSSSASRDPHVWFGGLLGPIAGKPGDGSVLQMGGGHWRVIETGGHCGGHLCLHDAGRALLISGDQVLPQISPNVSVYATAPEDDPLRFFLSSLDRLHACGPETLVLPSHGRPFRGLERRIDALTGHHHRQLDMLHDFYREPRTANEALPVMFGRVLRGIHRMLALGEALAHLHYLRADGKVERFEEDGVYKFVRV
jgi:glyoxylase-like metal-dependent hydrolase (beta-lactamase superfamily II)